MNIKVYIRVDANPDIGTGHFKRCLIIADYFSANLVTCSFIVSQQSHDYVQQHLNNKYFVNCIVDEKKEIEETEKILINEPNLKKVLITDGDKNLFYDKNYQQSILAQGALLFTITMFSINHFYSSIIHNQNPLSLLEDYSTEDNTLKLFGPDYNILNPSFNLIEKKEEYFFKSKPTIFVNFGGADNNDLTNQIVGVIYSEKIIFKKIIVVVGSLYSHKESLEVNLNRLPQDKVELYCDTNEISTLMNRSDIAITSGGLTVWELAYLGIPNFVLSTSIREKLTAELLSKKKLIHYLGHYSNESIFEKVKDELRKYLHQNEYLTSLSEKSSELIDGKGLERIYNELISVLNK